MADIKTNSGGDAQLLSVMKKQLFWQRITGVMMIVFVAAVVVIATRVAPMVQEIYDNLNALSGHIDSAVTELEEVTEKINELDLEGLLKNTDQLVQSSDKNLTEMTRNVSEAVKNLEDLDIDAFNQAIGRLNAVAGTLASLFGRS